MDGRDNNFGINFAPIGQAIKKARIAQNMTREQLAGIIEYSIRHVQSIENEGQFPSITCSFTSLAVELYSTV